MESAPADLLDHITLPCRVHRCKQHVFANTAWNIFGIKDWNAEILGVLWSTLCRISSGMTPLGSWNISAFNLYRLVLSETLWVLTSTVDTDMGSSMALPFFNYGVVHSFQNCLCYYLPINGNIVSACGLVPSTKLV